MTRTTPPRPFDITEVFPELSEHRGTTTRLHPRLGSPTPADSSIGGPLLWPADEPWPMCDFDDHTAHSALPPAAIRRNQAIYAAAGSWRLTDEEQSRIEDGIDMDDPPEGPVPLLPVMQLYRHDIPGFLGPADADLLQMLWCPLVHEAGPTVWLYWRRAADIGRVLENPPEPDEVEEFFLPSPCVLHPEQMADFPQVGLLPRDLEDRVIAWREEPGGPDYFSWSVVPGWKMGGCASWRASGPGTMRCQECAAEMTLLVMVGPSGDGDWIPIEDQADPDFPTTGVEICGNMELNVFSCPVSFDHPHRTTVQ